VKRIHAVPILLVFAAIVGTGAILALRQPDVIHVAGDDGRAVVDGHGVGTVAIVNAGARPGTGIPVEDISLSGLPLPAGFTLTLSYDPSVRAHAPRPLSIFGYDAPLSAWERVPSVDDPVSATLSAPTSVAATRWTYAVLPDDAVDPQAKVVLDQLVSFPPPGAVGYRAYVGLTQGGKDFFLLDGDFGQGGCGGAFHAGRAQSLTSHDLSQAGETARYEVQWEIGDGCPAGQKISPAL
jgi:hypothetical protein